jgi:site-specific DNA recombinase
MPESTRAKIFRCAIYTRKSSEEGLEQDFNSLDAQREACEAFIVSQKHEGWKAVPTRYDDGGYSGGTMERPALRRLLADIASRGVDVVVVYKVDRLTRALSDFAKIVEVFDAHGVSFVSVTQQFNTTTSMGRLTLNVLLSFAQFEREVTGERIRDKIAASKKKGMWMGGWVPIGYDLKDRALHINKDEARTVQTIFRLYRELGNARLVRAELDRRKLTTKRYVARTGRTIGGLPFRRGHIYWILSNPIYIGEIRHNSARHTGQHPAIIDSKTWTAVQVRLAMNRHKQRARSKSSNPLAGLLFDDQGNRLTPTYSTKNRKRYRYYAVLRTSSRSGEAAVAAPLRISAPEIESMVTAQVCAFLTHQKRLVDQVGLGAVKPALLRRIFTGAKELASVIEAGSTADVHAVAKLIDRVVVRPRAIRIEFSRHSLLKRLSEGIGTRDLDDDNDATIVIEAATTVSRRGTEMRLVLRDGPDKSSRLLDPALLKAIARGHVWFEELVSGRMKSITEIAMREAMTDRYVSQLISLAFLPPAIAEAVVEGRQPPSMTARRLTLGDGAQLSWRTEEHRLRNPMF